MKKPWQIHPDLTADRLIVVAGLLSTVRSDAVDDYCAEKGDGRWGLGCRVYERSMFAIAKATQTYPWLRIVEWSGLRFVFAIGTVPIKFYHGDHEDNAEPRRLRRSFPEMRQQQAAFDFVPNAEMDSVLRLVVETDDEGRAENIFLVQLDLNGVPHNPWDIPFQAQPGTTVMDEFRKDGIDLPAPSIGDEPISYDEDEAAEGDDEASAGKK